MSRNKKIMQSKAINIETSPQKKPRGKFLGEHYGKASLNALFL